MRVKLLHTIPVVVAVGILAVWSLSTNPIEPVLDQKTPTPLSVASSTPEQELVNYIEVIDSCGPHFESECVNVRSGAGSTFPAVAKLRNGVILAVATTTTTDEDGDIWYKVVFNEWIRYPERIGKDWYIVSTYARGFTDTGMQEQEEPLPALLQQAGEKLGLIPPEKRIIVDRSEQKLYAYEGDMLFVETAISTGLDLTPTPRGTFSIYRKTPSRYMQGPLLGISDQYYDLPGVPWNMYFTKEGGAIHGAYWHAEFGKQWSHGCVNLPLDTAHVLYDWAPLGTKVIVRD